MKDLVGIFEELDGQDIKTYIQSGNVVFKISDTNITGLSDGISAKIKMHLAFVPSVLLLNLGELEKIVVNNPFPEGENDPKGLHIGFLAATPQHPDLKKLESLRTKKERFSLIDRAFYLYAPDGIGRSKLAANAERLLGSTMTDRNWRTVCKLLEMAKDLD